MKKSGQPRDPVADWAWKVITCPSCHESLKHESSKLYCSDCGPVGYLEDGIFRFPAFRVDASIRWYQDKGGAHFYERSRVPYAMSALDTPVYHRFLAKLRPPNLAESIVVDVGAGDGRNTAPWLAWGFKRVVAVDAVCASLARFRQRIRRQHPAWLDRILMVECDARQIPLSSAQADIVIAIESLYYLNEDYPRGLAECVRIMKPNGRIFLAERSWEGALLARLLYSGVGAMLSIAKSRDMWDGGMQDSVRSRCFTETELIAMLRGRGLEPLEVKGIPLLPLILGYLRSQGSLKRGDGKLLGRLGHLLQDLGEHGQMRRTYAVVAAKASARVRARQ